MNGRLPRGVLKGAPIRAPQRGNRLEIGRIERLKRWKSDQAGCNQLSRGKTQTLRWFFRKLLEAICLSETNLCLYRQGLWAIPTSVSVNVHRDLVVIC